MPTNAGRKLLSLTQMPFDGNLIGRDSKHGERPTIAPITNSHCAHHRYPVGRKLDSHHRQAAILTERLSEYPTNYFISICIKTSAMAEQNTPRLP